LGLISPHAGYAYSGQTAAYAYHQLESRRVDTVVIVAPSHRAWLGDYAVSEEHAYETPLGLVPLDGEFIATLGEHLALRRVRGDAEHSLEIQLPFLQRQLGDFRLVPMLTSADDPVVAGRLADALAQVVHQRLDAGAGVLLVASSDLHHIDNYDEVVRRDQAVVDAIAAYDLETLTQLLVSPGSSVCGRMPILAVLHAAKILGADEATILHHTNSGDVTGQRQPGQYTVGYMAAAVTKID
jgi:AmmeMemoRadiSam system protein B